MYLDLFTPAAIATPISLILLLILGIGTGTVAGVLGIGGGLLIVPLLTLWQVALVQATATSLVGVAVSAISGSGRNWAQGQLKWRSALALGLAGLPSAQWGAWAANQLPDRGLAFGFALFAIVMIQLVAYKQKLIVQSTLSNTVQSAVQSQATIPTIAIGLGAGFLSGLFGVGGGAIMVPLQMVYLNEPIKSAVRTSLGAIVLIALSGLWRYSLQGNVLWLPGFALAIGGFIGAQFGTRLLNRLSSDRVNLYFRTLLILLALYMSWRGIRSGA